jgi:hypothetical protein
VELDPDSAAAKTQADSALRAGTHP